MKIARNRAPKLASQKPPGIVTVVFANPLPMSVAIGLVADDQPQAPPPTSTASSTSVLALTPATVIERGAATLSCVCTNFSLSAGLPEPAGGDVRVRVMTPSTGARGLLGAWMSHGALDIPNGCTRWSIRRVETPSS